METLHKSQIAIIIGKQSELHNIGLALDFIAEYWTMIQFCLCQQGIELETKNKVWKIYKSDFGWNEVHFWVLKPFVNRNIDFFVQF